MNEYLFQYCLKLVVFRNDDTEVLLAKRDGQADYDGVFSFIAGKMETADESIVAGIKREKDEEVGEHFSVKLYPTFSENVLFRKKDGNTMVLPHYYAQYVSGEIELNEEHSEFIWVKVSDIDTFEPLIPTVPGIVKNLLRLRDVMEDGEFVEI